MLNIRRSFLFLFLVICAASSALAYPISYSINVTFVDIPGDSDPLGLGTQPPPDNMATITATLESVTPPGSGTYAATVTLVALGKTLPSTGTITITTGGIITANFSNSSGSFLANVVLPGITFPYPAPLAFGTVGISSPASTVNYNILGAVGTVGVTGTVTATGLTATPTTISASYAGGAAPGAQTISISDSTAPSGFTASVGPGSNHSSTTFLTVTPISGTTPAQVGLTFSTSVSPGTYTADVLVNTSSDTSGAPLSIPVTYTVTSSGVPQLQFSPPVSSFSFFTPSSTSTATQQISVSVPSGGSNGSFTAAVTSGGSFLSVSPSSGNTPGVLTVTANDTGLASGFYSGAITVTVPGFPAAILNVNVSISSSSSGGGGGTTTGLTISPTSLTINVPAGGSSGGGSVSIKTPTPVTFSVSNVDFYLPITPLSGTTNATITIPVNASTLANGTYSDNILISAGGKSVTLPVTVNVGSVTDISLNTPLVNFTSPGGTLSSTITVSSDTSAQFSYTLAPSAPWISVTPTSGTSPSSFTITVNPVGLPVGVSSGTVMIASPSVRNSPQLVRVSLNVTQASASPLTATPAAILFAATPGGTAPPSQTVQLAPVAASPGYTVTAIGSPWLTAALNATTGAVTLTANPTGLAAGTYPGSVEVSSSGITNSPYYLPVTLVVSTATFSAEPAALNFGGTTGGASPAPQTVTIAFPGGVASNSITVGASSVPWLTTALSAPSLTVTTSTTGLAAGTYTTTISISAASGSNSQTIAVPVTLTVGTPATPSIAAVTSSISYLTTAPAAPDDLMAIFGTNLTSGSSGGNVPAGDTYSGLSVFGAPFSGLEVFANGIPCPILYASPSQINMILPSALAGQTTAAIYLNAYGVISNVVTIPIAASSPALFSAGSSGTGAGAILNPDLTLNTSTNPAAVGAEIALFGGGAGVTTPLVPDGQVVPTTAPFPTTAAVTATVAGLPATVDYYGAAPGLVAGVLQVNLTIPAGTPSGAQPVVITVGGVSSQAGITVSVQ